MVLPSPENGSVTPEAQAAPVPITLTATNATADTRSFFLVVMLLPFLEAGRCIRLETDPRRLFGLANANGSNVGARRCRGHRACPATSPRASPDAVGAFQAVLRRIYASWEANTDHTP